MSNWHDDFTPEPSSYWRRYVVGDAALELTGTTARLVTIDTTARRYSDAQLDDYRVGNRRPLLWRPPLRLYVRARFSHPDGELRGTAGFGFWNYPLALVERRLPRLPKAIWFFYGSSPANIQLDLNTPGYGWKAATIDTQRPQALALLPLAPPAILLMQSRRLYQRIWPFIQRAVGVREASVAPAMTDWHDYAIAWGLDEAHFSVDGSPVLAYAPAPHGPLCFVIWLDNQYLIVTPRGKFGWGLLAAPGRQWLEVNRLVIETGPTYEAKP